MSEIGQTRSRPRVGYIGLGRMGGPMADNLLRKGFALGIYDVSTAATGPRVAAGATLYASPAELAAQCDLLFTCLPGPAESEAVMLGKDGIVEGIGPDTICIECTTGSPDFIRSVSARLNAVGAHMIEACVSGGPWNSEAGQLVMILGGEEDIIARARLALDAVASRLHWVGAIGLGTTAKLVHNMVHNVTIQLAVEAMLLALKSGIDADTMLAILQEGAVGQGAVYHAVLPRMIDGAPLGSQFFPLSLSYKDLGLATSHARAVDVPLGFAAIAEQNFLEAIARGLGPNDNRALASMMGERAGISEGLVKAHWPSSDQTAPRDSGGG